MLEHLRHFSLMRKNFDILKTKIVKLQLNKNINENNIKCLNHDSCNKIIEKTCFGDKSTFIWMFSDVVSMEKTSQTIQNRFPIHVASILNLLQKMQKLEICILINRTIVV